MKATQEVFKAVEEYNRIYLDMPQTVYIPPKTLEIIKDECGVYFRPPAGTKAEIYGMTIVEEQRLPDGLIVVGGVLRDVLDGKEE